MLRLLDPSTLPLPDAGVFHNPAAVALTVQVLQLVTVSAVAPLPSSASSSTSASSSASSALPAPAPASGGSVQGSVALHAAVAFQLRLLRYIRAQAQAIAANQARQSQMELVVVHCHYAQ